MPATDTTHRLTQADIARLAVVERPVVTMWRKRHTVGAGAFPSPCAVTTTGPLFDRAEVVTWLAATGHGNNEEVRAEASLYSAPPVAGPHGLALCQALLTVRELTRESLTELDPDDVRALAEECDPADRCLLGEIETASDEDIVACAPFVDALRGAAYGPLSAMNALEGRAGLFGAEVACRPRAEVHALVGALATALAELAGGLAGCTLVDPTGGGRFLEPAGETTWPGPLALPVEPLGAEGTNTVRAAWRRLRAGGLNPMPLNDGGLPDRAVQVLSVRHAPEETPAALIERIDELVGALSHGQWAIVVGPAEPMTDALPGPADEPGTPANTRHYLLRKGTLRAAVRLGAGVWADQPLAHGALWLLGTARPSRSHPHARVATADLTGRSLTDLAEELVTDLLAALADDPPPASAGKDAPVEETVHHEFHLLHHELISDLFDEERANLARHSVTPMARRTAEAAARRSVDEAEQLAMALAAGLPGVAADVRRTPAAGERGRTMTVAQLLAAKRLSAVPGTRLTPGLAQRGIDGVPVIGAAEVLGEAPVGERRVRLWEFAAAHPNAGLTDPGDVVFVTGPCPGAWVDADGSSVVEFPARVLRVREMADATHRQRLVPRVLCADLAAMPGREWRAAHIRLIPRVQAADLRAVLDQVAAARDAALARAADLHRFTQLLADGVAGGTLTASTIDSTPEGH